MGYLCCSGKMSENSKFKIQCFAHHMSGLKHYIIHVGSPESYGFSGFSSLFWLDLVLNSVRYHRNKILTNKLFCLFCILQLGINRYKHREILPSIEKKLAAVGKF